jgi:hypothetical protein
VCRHEAASQFVEFIIDETFGVPGVGTVVAGTVKRGVITINTTLLLGPDVGKVSLTYYHCDSRSPTGTSQTLFFPHMSCMSKNMCFRLRR